MSIQIHINIPDEDIGLGTEALAKRMAVLGYAFGAEDVPVNVGGAVPLTFTHTMTTAEAVAAEPLKEEPKKRTRKAKDEPAPNITASPENRVEPVLDDEATAAQDEADEKAEAVELARLEEDTVETLRALTGEFITRFTMAKAMQIGPGVFNGALGAPPDGEPHWSNSAVAKAGPDAIKKACAAWRAAIIEAAQAERLAKGGA